MLRPAQAEARDDIALAEPASPSEMLREAVVRMEAELRAAGFHLVRETSPEPGGSEEASHIVGVIELEETPNTIDIRTRATLGGTPLAQQIDPRHPQTTAEVIAIRAVESLRATLVQALRSREQPSLELSERVQSFTGYDEAPPSPPPQATPPEQTAPVAPTPPKRTRPKKELGALLTLSPTIVALSTTGFSGALEGRATMRYGAWSLGVVGEGSVIPYRESGPEGRLSVYHLSVLLRPAWLARLGKRWELSLGLEAGLHQFHFVTQGEENVSAQNAAHSSLLVQGDLSVSRFWQNGLGIHWFLRGGALSNVPTVIFENSEQDFGRPLISSGLGIAYRIPHTPAAPPFDARNSDARNSDARN